MSMTEIRSQTCKNMRKLVVRVWSSSQAQRCERVNEAGRTCSIVTRVACECMERSKKVDDRVRSESR